MRVHHHVARARAFDSSQPSKQGLWFGHNLQTALWRLNPGQRIVAHQHPRADDVMIVIEGQGEYLYYDSPESPAPETCYQPDPCRVVVPPSVPSSDDGTTRISVEPGSIVMTAHGVFHALRNSSDGQLVLAVVTGPDSSDSVYTVR